MNTGFQLQLADISVAINVLVRFITALFFIGVLIPLVVKEANVKNGLKLLRYQLLVTGMIIFLINSIGLFIILFRHFGFDTRLVTEVVTYFNSFGFLIYALVQYKIYTQHYTPENKKIHEQIEKFEKGVKKNDNARKR